MNENNGYCVNCGRLAPDEISQGLCLRCSPATESENENILTEEEFERYLENIRTGCGMVISPFLVEWDLLRAHDNALREKAGVK